MNASPERFCKKIARQFDLTARFCFTVLTGKLRNNLELNGYISRTTRSDVFIAAYLIVYFLFFSIIYLQKVNTNVNFSKFLWFDTRPFQSADGVV